MTEQPDDQNIDLEEFLATAGRSFTSAQQSMLGGTGVTASMMLDTAELEVKVSMESSKEGRMKIRPVSLSDISNNGIDPAALSTLKIRLVGTINETPKVVSQETGPNISPDKVAVPNLVGKSLRDASAELAALKWKYEAHAADSKTIAAAGEKKVGKVIRQTPSPAAVDTKKTDTVHIWINLGSTPVETIDGIGEKMGASLKKIGIRSVGDLSLADVKELASYLHLNEARTQDFIHMATLMSRLTILGLKDEVVELLIKGLNIRSVEALAAANPTKLYNAAQKALAAGKILSPKKFVLNKNDVQGWITTAKSAI